MEADRKAALLASFSRSLLAILEGAQVHTASSDLVVLVDFTSCFIDKNREVRGKGDNKDAVTTPAACEFEVLSRMNAPTYLNLRLLTMEKLRRTTKTTLANDWARRSKCTRPLSPL